MHPFISSELAELRGEELRRLAERERLVTACARASAGGRRLGLAGVRRAVGFRLVKAGLRLAVPHR
jgi:hypothetical protein